MERRLRGWSSLGKTQLAEWRSPPYTPAPRNHFARYIHSIPLRTYLPVERQ